MATPSVEFGQVAPGRATKFDPWRVVVRTWWGLGKPFEPDAEFVKRPWHKIDKLSYAVETLRGQIKLADAECVIGYEIEVAYQPNVDFAKDWFRMHKQLPTAVFADFKQAVTDAVRDEFTRFTAATILNDAEFLAAQTSISTAVRRIFETKGITCDAYCRFGRPVIEWPKQDPNTPQPLPPGQNFYKAVKTQNSTFFLEQDRIKNDEAAARDQQADANANAVAARAAKRRSDERRRIADENADEILKAQLEDAKSAAIRVRAATNDVAELAHKRDQKIRLMDTERDLRRHRIDLGATDEEFLTCESDLFRKEGERLRAEEEAKRASVDVAAEHEIRLSRERNLAEHAVQMQRDSEVLKTLSSALQQLGATSQPIEHLRIVQMPTSAEAATALPNSLPFQLAQALSLIREVLKATDLR